ncbi:MAG: (d)CMP kinase [Eubacteriales bacterium]
MRAIALDGPSGAGKSTLARKLATELGYRYVDTGAIYRTVALGLTRGNIPFDTVELSHLESLNIKLTYHPEGAQIMKLGEADVSEEIRKNEISILTSQVAAIPCVRDFLLDVQRNVAKQFEVVMDGRDIGTVVLPDAEVKIFLTATPEERTRRRVNELIERGQPAQFDTILAEMLARDHSDTTRTIAPLKQAEGAILLDTTTLNFEQSLAALLQIVQERMVTHE